MTSHMLQPTHDPKAEAGSAAPAGRLKYAFGLGAAAAIGAGLLTTVAGVLPDATGAFVWLGITLALAAAALGLGLHLRARGSAAGGPSAAMHLQASIAGGFVIKLAMLAAGVLVLQARGTKFESVAAFAIAFAAASLVFQVPAAGYLMATAQRRLQRTGGGDRAPGRHADN